MKHSILSQVLDQSARTRCKECDELMFFILMRNLNIYCHNCVFEVCAMYVFSVEMIFSDFKGSEYF